eukprot:m51a1_g6910 hypothetical protein (241) ;mRNA; f:116999-118093
MGRGGRRGGGRGREGRRDDFDDDAPTVVSSGSGPTDSARRGGRSDRSDRSGRSDRGGPAVRGLSVGQRVPKFLRELEARMPGAVVPGAERQRQAAAAARAREAAAEACGSGGESEGEDDLERDAMRRAIEESEQRGVDVAEARLMLDDAQRRAKLARPSRPRCALRSLGGEEEARKEAEAPPAYGDRHARGVVPADHRFKRASEREDTADKSKRQKKDDSKAPVPKATRDTSMLSFGDDE